MLVRMPEHRLICPISKNSSPDAHDTLERNARISHQLDARLDLVRGAFDQLVYLLGGFAER
jgi:hypothetical protein